MHLFLCGCFHGFFPLSLVFKSLIVINLSMVFFRFIPFVVYSASWICRIMSFVKCVKCSANIFLRIFFIPLSFSFSFGTLMTQILGILLLSCRFVRLRSFFFLSMFSLCCSDWANSIDLSSSLLIISSVKSYLLLSSYSTLFFPVILFLL